MTTSIPNVLFVSCPRSGAHLTRALLEACTNHFMETTKIFPTTTGSCIGLHTHDLNYMHAYALQRRKTQYTHLLVVTRDPLDVLYSQCQYNKLCWENESNTSRVKATLIQILSHQKIYDALKVPIPKMTVTYNELTRSPSATVAAICCFLGLEQPSPTQLQYGINCCTKDGLRDVVRHDPRAISPSTEDYSNSREEFKTKFGYMLI